MIPNRRVEPRPHPNAFSPDPREAFSAPRWKLVLNRSWLTRREAMDLSGLSQDALRFLVRDGHVRLVRDEGIFAKYDRSDLDAAVVSGAAAEAELEGQRRGEAA